MQQLVEANILTQGKINELVIVVVWFLAKGELYVVQNGASDKSHR